MAASDAWVRLGSFPFRQAADVAWSVLDGHGIPARVAGDDAGGIAPHIGLATGGAFIEVPGSRLDEARAILGSMDADPPGTDQR